MNHKIPLRFISAAAAGVLLSAISLSAVSPWANSGISAAAPAPVTADGISVRTEFPDVTPDKWFYDDVTALAERGIISGYPDGYFYPDLEVSNSDFVKILISSVGYDIDMPVGEEIFPDNWASEYLSLAYMLGFITDEAIEAGFVPEAPITRADMTRMTVLALGIDPAPIDDPFSDTSDDYAKAAFGEYILRGVPDEKGGRLYNGAGSATRSEAAAIAMRIIGYMNDPYEFFKEQVLSNAAHNYIETETEFMDLFYVLNRELMEEFTFKTALPMDVWTRYYNISYIINLEYFYFSELLCSYVPGNNTYKLILKYENDLNKLEKFQTEASEAADEVVSRILDENMTADERIKAIHDYLVLYCEYDYVNYTDGKIPVESLVAYGPLNAHIAVCQGYAAAFNMLCERAGIRSAAVNGISPASPEAHVWNMVLLDGDIFYVDVTRDDPVPDKKGQISYKYYLRTEDEMTMLGYLWDKSTTKLKYLY